MPAITEVHAREILDSRGNPTVEVDVTVDGGFGRASVPSGASTGSREALELRDGGKRYCGKGVRNAVAWVNTMIADSVVGHNWPTQQSLDVHMCWLDGTADKHKLGANAILGVSTAFARATAAASRRPLYACFADMLSLHAAGKAPAVQMPVPMMNIINGGAHAANGLAVQEFMIVPVGAPTFAEALRYGAEIFHALGSHLRQQGLATSVGDEGGFAPDLSDNEAALDAIATAVTTVGLRFGDDIALALDIAASEFHHDDMYVLPRRRYTTDAFIDYLDKLVDAYPVLSIEDGLAEDDWEGWAQLTTRLGNRVQLVGDDLFVTNAAMLERGIKAGVANAVLVKINQIGTITETMATIAKAHAGGYRAVVSHRSGETEDVTIADLAVGCGVGQIKTGSLCRSDRVAKYNQLLRIEEATNAPYPGRAAFAH